MDNLGTELAVLFALSGLLALPVAYIILALLIISVIAIGVPFAAVIFLVRKKKKNKTE